eukprot:Skav202089  [mRNA]  locus=scaffold513:176142:176729:+ [translate_table: standard]
MLAQHDDCEDGKDRLAMCQVLLEARAAVNRIDRSGWSPLHWAAFCDNVNLLRFLVQNRADGNLYASDCGNKTPLWVAANAGYLENIRFLLQECNADVNHADANGCTPLMTAILEHVPSHDIFDNRSSVQLLLEYRADMDQMDTGGRTPLKMAVERDLWDIQTTLIENGAKIGHSLRPKRSRAEEIEEAQGSAMER